MCSVNAIRDDADIFPTKIFFQVTGGSPRNGGKRDPGIGVNPALQSGQQRVINAPVQPSEKIAVRCRGVLFFAGKLLQSMEKRMNDYHIRMQAIDSWRQNKIAGHGAKCPMPPSQKPVQEHPREELSHMRARDGRNLMPKNGARFRSATRLRLAYSKISDALRIKVDLATVILGEPFEQFRESALRTMATIDKRRDNREPQVSEPSAAQVESRER